MSELQFRSRPNRDETATGLASVAGWLVLSAAALAIVVLGLVIVSAPPPPGSPSDLPTQDSATGVVLPIAPSVDPAPTATD